MRGNVLVTGGSGLIGRHLIPALRLLGYGCINFDLRASPGLRGDVCDEASLASAIADAVGIVHLAAVSRVVWGENNPDMCLRTNVDGTRNVVAQATRAKRKPWIVLASSREVYGQQRDLPVAESAALSPMNHYARTKVFGEQALAAANGNATAIVRLSSVYSDAEDHRDRVIPAFCRAALAGDALRIEGSDHCFDFTNIADVVAGLLRVVEVLDDTGESLPPIHLVSGQGTTLRQLANSVIVLCASRSDLVEMPARTYDVARFTGDPARAQSLLGWRATTTLEKGLSVLIRQLKETRGRVRVPSFQPSMP